MTLHKYTFRQFNAARDLLLAGAMTAIWISGCAMPLEKAALLKDNTPNVAHIQGPQERSLRNWFKKKEAEQEQTFGQSFKPIAGQDAYLAAVDIYKDKRYPEAQKAFKAVAKKYKKSEIREDALFMQAECAWEQDHYAKAHDVYAVLLKDFPSTRHLTVISERMFKIGRLWLDFPEVAKLGEIQQVNFEDPSKHKPSEEPPKMPKKVPIWVMNLRNKEQPLFDTPGNGVAALTAVWMHDPAGPLADDAMMLVASYHARRGNYVEAKRHFQNLRELYPSSPHVENAFLLNAHVTAMCYEGPAYETRPLEEAEMLKQSILRIYKDTPEAPRLRDELAKLQDSKAEVLWQRALFYQGKGARYKRSAAIYCHQVITQYPKSPYAEKARAKLVELGPEYESGAIFLTTKETGQRTLAERILEPETPEWLKNPRTLMASRKRRPPTDDQSVARSKSRKSDSASDQGMPEEPSSDDDLQLVGESRNPDDKPRLLPAGGDQDSSSNDEDIAKETAEKSSSERSRR